MASLREGYGKGFWLIAANLIAAAAAVLGLHPCPGKAA